MHPQSIGSVWLLLVGVGSGMFNSPNTAAMMGAVPVHRRGVAAGARTVVQNTGAVLSIAFVMAVVTAAVPKDVLLQIFSGLASSLSARQLDPFVANMHTALWALAATSLAGAGVSLLRPRHSAESVEAAAPPARREEITRLEDELDGKRRTFRARLAELERTSAAGAPGAAPSSPA
jgi:hypothetical protein